jgi:hypothetical protein
MALLFHLLVPYAIESFRDTSVVLVVCITIILHRYETHDGYAMHVKVEVCHGPSYVEPSIRVSSKLCANFFLATVCSCFSPQWCYSHVLLGWASQPGDSRRIGQIRNLGPWTDVDATQRNATQRCFSHPVGYVVGHVLQRKEALGNRSQKGV